MKAFLGFIIGLVTGILVDRYFIQPSPPATAQGVRDGARETVGKVEHGIKDSIDVDRLKEELARTGRVIREKSRRAGEAIADVTANARISTAIKAKLVEDPGLRALTINVDTTDGVVTLSGTVSSHDEIARAVALALETDGVHKVISTLQVKPA
jgi:osmotically-inducible protein OsmY